MTEVFEELAAKFDIKSIVITMILSALGFLVALTWRDAIQQTIDLFIPRGQGLYYTYLAAVLITVIAVIVTVILIQIKKKDIIPDAIEEKIKKKMKEEIRSKIKNHAKKK